MNTTPAPAPIPALPSVEADADRSVVRRLWDVFRREPMLLVTCSYLFVSIVGLWDLYWFYRRFDIPILEFLQSSDYFVSGLRRPVYLALLGWTLLASLLVLLPERWRRRNPERAAQLDRRWWFRLFFPRRSDWWAYLWLHPETMATVSALFAMGIVLFSTSTTRAERIQAGGGAAVQVHLADAPLAGDWRMLGTSSAYVFLWDPGRGLAEVVPIESIARMRPLPPPVPAERTPDPTPAADVPAR